MYNINLGDLYQKAFFVKLVVQIAQVYYIWEMVSYCLNSLHDKGCLILTDVETLDVQKSVAV